MVRRRLRRRLRLLGQHFVSSVADLHSDLLFSVTLLALLVSWVVNFLTFGPIEPRFTIRSSLA